MNIINDKILILNLKIKNYNDYIIKIEIFN